MITPKRRRSQAVSLVLLGSFMAGCGPSDPDFDSMDKTRNFYTDRYECIRDWDNELYCEVDSSGGYYGPYYVVYSGRTYYFDRRGSSYKESPKLSGRTPSGSAIKVPAASAPKAARGGFGSSSRGFSSS